PAAYAAVTVRFKLMCTSAVRNAGVGMGIANRSRNPGLAAASAPIRPTAISHSEPCARKPGSRVTCEAMSKTRLAVQAPIGTVTKSGWNGWPYGPARADTGRLACCLRSAADGITPSYLTKSCWSYPAPASTPPARAAELNFSPTTAGVIVEGVQPDDVALSAAAALTDEHRRRMYA